MRPNQEIPSDIAYCPHCGNNAVQLATGTQVGGNEPDVMNYWFTICTTCKHALLYRAKQDRSERPTMQSLLAPKRFTFSDKEMVWPNAGNLHKSVPESVRSCYQEASLVKSRSANAFANQIRRSLEFVCRDRNANGRTLNDQLRDLRDKGEIPPVLTEMTDILRMLGNMGSHADVEGVDPVYVDAIDEFFRAVVEYVYVAPHRVNEVRTQMDAAHAARSGKS